MHLYSSTQVRSRVWKAREARSLLRMEGQVAGGLHSALVALKGNHRYWRVRREETMLFYLFIRRGRTWNQLLTYTSKVHGGIEPAPTSR